MAVDPARVLRLSMPLWQGCNNPNYLIGGRVLAAIAPEAAGPVETKGIPPVDAVERPKTKGIVSLDALLNILSLIREAIVRHDPQAIVTLGGDCFVDLAPIAYLNE